MDALTRCLTLAPLLWPALADDAFDVRLSRDGVAIRATLLAGTAAVATLDAADGAAALDALAALLAAAAHDRSDDLLRAAGLPMPCADRFAELERELRAARCKGDSVDEALSRLRSAVASLASGGTTGVEPILAAYVGEATALDVQRIAAALATRVDPQPPQRAPGVVAGVSADVVDGWCDRLNHALRGDTPDLAGEVVSVVSAMRAEARQRAGGGEGRGERVEQRQAGGGGVGAVAQAAGVERVVVAEGVAGTYCGGGTIGGELVGFGPSGAAEGVVFKHEGQRVRLVVEVLRGEGGSVHDTSVSPATSTGKAHAS